MDIIRITDVALKKIDELIAACCDNSILGIRINVKSGGCSGFKYAIEYTNKIEKFDEVIRIANVTVVIDPKAIMYVIGTEMDYVEDQFRSSFVFNNPNEKSKCGCGKSFNV